MEKELYTRRELAEITGLPYLVIHKIFYVQAYKDAIKDFQGEITAKSLYELIKKSCREMILSESVEDGAIYAMKRLSEEVTNDGYTWVKECGLELKERRTTRSGRILYDIVKGV